MVKSKSVTSFVNIKVEQIKGSFLPNTNIGKAHKQVEILNTDTEEDQPIDIEQEITEYLDSKKLRLVKPDEEFYMRMP